MNFSHHSPVHFWLVVNVANWLLSAAFASGSQKGIKGGRRKKRGRGEDGGEGQKTGARIERARLGNRGWLTMVG